MLFLEYAPFGFLETFLRSGRYVLSWGKRKVCLGVATALHVSHQCSIVHCLQTYADPAPVTAAA